MGYGRVNANNSLQLIDGPWLALDRPHYVCGGDLTVAMKDLTAGATAQVTVTGSVGGDVETVTVDLVPGATGFYEGTIPISWTGVDGPVVLGDVLHQVTRGKLGNRALFALSRLLCCRVAAQLDAGQRLLGCLPGLVRR